jgi:acyl-CoA reductase-like NAD-dependent aldehyde dehydrogenase
MPYDEGAELGPLSTRPQFERVTELVDDAVRRGAKVAAGGAALPGDGYFFQPTILTDVAEGVPIVDEEQFGPALPILKYDSVEEAVERANNTTYGLAGSVWGADADRATQTAEQLEVGTTFINTHCVLPVDVPFSGAKWSGLGVSNGVAGLISYTEPQVVHRVAG